ncbi:MAG: alkaline shock response membrane anchor protein AmaP [Bacillota bacterium]|nr:alkaline shock response membrane anchor protein AmaP [Bacillota bacterium]
MTILLRMLLFVYNLLLTLIGVAVVAVAVGRTEPLAYLTMAFSTQQNRWIAGIIGGVLGVLGILGIVYSLKRHAGPDAIVVEDGFHGQVSISITAIKVIIMKAVKQVDGVKDIRIAIQSSSEGLMVTLHTMVNPELPVPDLTRSIQTTVKEYLQSIGGLQVAGVKVLVDDFNAGNK